MNNKYLETRLFFLFYILFSVIFSFLGAFGGDSSFPISGGKTYWSDTTFLFMWMDTVLGTTAILDKLRGLGQFIFSGIGVFYLKLFLPFFSSLGALGFYKILSLENNNNNDGNSLILKILVSIMFVFNPLTIAHIPHTFIIQGYFIMPWVIFFYYKYLTENSNPFTYLVGFLFSICFLGQPHNYYNAIVLLVILQCFLIFDKKTSIIKVIKRAILALILTVGAFAYVILPFVMSLPNDITASTSGFQGTEPNMIWSSSQGPLNTLLFKSSIFYSDLLRYFYLILMSFLIFGILFKKDGTILISKYRTIAIGLILLFSLSFIARNPFLSDPGIRQLIYFFAPHIRVDIAYALIAYIPLFLLFIFKGISLYKKRFPFIIVLLLLFLTNISLFFVYSYKETEKNNVNKFTEFSKEISELINWNTTETILFYPNNVSYRVEGINKPNYPGILLNFEHNKSFYHWNFLEVTLNDSRKFLNSISGADYVINFLSKTDTRYIFCFMDETDCGLLLDNDNIYPYGRVGNIEVFENKNFNDRFLSSINYFTRNNVTNYLLSKKLDHYNGNNSIYFLQSFHPGWKLYLEPYNSINCSDEGLVYSGTVSGEGSIGTESHHVTECPSENRFYVGGELSRLWQEPIFDDTHKMVYGYANQWTIDPEYIRANYPREYYYENPDGTIDVRMTLYFRPQSYFYLGLIISGLTLFGCIGYLIVSRTRRYLNRQDS